MVRRRTMSEGLNAKHYDVNCVGNISATLALKKSIVTSKSCDDFPNPVQSSNSSI